MVEVRPLISDSACRPQSKAAAFGSRQNELTGATGGVEWSPAARETSSPSYLPGAIGFDWFFAGDGGVPWLISWPRKKLITQQLPTSSSLWLPNYGSSGLGIPA